MTPTEHDLTTQHVARATRGDDSSRAWLFERFTGLLRAQASYRLRGSLRTLCEPDDLVQEVWSIALPRLSSLQARDGRLTPVLLRYLATTLARRISYHARRRRVDPLGEQDAPAADSGVTAQARRSEVHSAVHEAIEHLDHASREVVVLRGIEQHTNAETADMLGLSSGAVAMRYKRALERLRRQLPRSVFEDM